MPLDANAEVEISVIGAAYVDRLSALAIDSIEQDLCGLAPVLMFQRVVGGKHHTGCQLQVKPHQDGICLAGFRNPDRIFGSKCEIRRDLKIERSHGKWFAEDMALIRFRKINLGIAIRERVGEDGHRTEVESVDGFDVMEALQMRRLRQGTK